jgi:hypothetical protein
MCYMPEEIGAPRSSQLLVLQLTAQGHATAELLSRNESFAAPAEAVSVVCAYRSGCVSPNRSQRSPMLSKSISRS